MYDYHNSEERQRRLIKQSDRCQSTHQGRVFKIHAGMLVDTSLGAEPVAPAGGFIFAIIDTMEIRVARDGARIDTNSIKHESLFHNAHVEAAGELVFDNNGTVVEINDKSGSYGTYGQLKINPRFAESVIDALVQAGVPLSPQCQRQLTP